MAAGPKLALLLSGLGLCFVASVVPIPPVSLWWVHDISLFTGGFLLGVHAWVCQ